MDTDSRAVYDAALEEQLRSFVDEARHHLLHCLDGLTEAEARQRLVASKTTLMGLVKHATFVERVWFEEAVTGRPRSETGMAQGPNESFDLDPSDSVESVSAGYKRAWAASDDAVRGFTMDHVLTGNRRGPLTLRWVHLHVLAELAQHRGHADILREQVLAARGS